MFSTCTADALPPSFTLPSLLLLSYYLRHNVRDVAAAMHVRVYCPHYINDTHTHTETSARERIHGTRTGYLTKLHILYTTSESDTRKHDKCTPGSMRVRWFTMVHDDFGGDRTVYRSHRGCRDTDTPVLVAAIYWTHSIESVPSDVFLLFANNIYNINIRGTYDLWLAELKNDCIDVRTSTTYSIYSSEDYGGRGGRRLYLGDGP